VLDFAHTHPFFIYQAGLEHGYRRQRHNLQPEYTPAIGTVLNSGAGQTLLARFTPTDLDTYSAVTTKVTLDVTPGSQTNQAILLFVTTYILLTHNNVRY
jgi:hypothetical protein